MKTITTTKNGIGCKYGQPCAFQAGTSYALLDMLKNAMDMIVYKVQDGDEHVIYIAAVYFS